MNRKKFFLFLVYLTLVYAAFAWFSSTNTVAVNPTPGQTVQPCSKQVVTLPDDKVTDQFSAAGTIIDNSNRMVIGAENSAFLLASDNGVTYELQFCDNPNMLKDAKTMAGTPVHVKGKLIERDKVETHARKIIFVDSISALLAQPQTPK